jgi:hypothetical protein
MAESMQSPPLSQSKCKKFEIGADRVKPENKSGNSLWPELAKDFGIDGIQPALAAASPEFFS